MVAVTEIPDPLECIVPKVGPALLTLPRGIRPRSNSSSEEFSSLPEPALVRFSIEPGAATGVKCEKRLVLGPTWRVFAYLGIPLKNQAPDFFQISLCSAQILHSQMASCSPLAPLPPVEGLPPNKAELMRDVIDDDIDEDEVKDEARWFLPMMDCPGAKWYSRPHLPQVILAHSTHRFCEWW